MLTFLSALLLRATSPPPPPKPLDLPPPQPDLSPVELPLVSFDGVTARFGSSYLHFLVINDTDGSFSAGIFEEGGPLFGTQQWVNDRWETGVTLDVPVPGRLKDLNLAPGDCIGFLVPLEEPRLLIRAGVSVCREDRRCGTAWSKPVDTEGY